MKDKKGAGFTIQKLMGIVIVFMLLLVVYLVFFSEEGTLQDAKNSTLAVIDTITPNVTIGADAISAEKPAMLESGGEEKINTLVKTIENMLASDKKNCFAYYGGMPEFEEKGTSLVFESDNKGNTVLKISGGAGGKQEVSRETISGMIPCVIARSKTVTKNFEKSFLNKNDPKNILNGHYHSANVLTISWDDGGYFGHTENRIDFDGNGKEDLEDGGFLYTPDNRHICFFPTVNGDMGGNCNGGSKVGLDDDCLTDQTEKISVPYQLNKGTLTKCY